jgi:hypothetical protein
VAFKIRISAVLVAVLIIGIISGRLLLDDRFIFTSAKTDPVKTVILDAGHGGLTNTIMAIFFETVQPHCFGAKS